MFNPADHFINCLAESPENDAKSLLKICDEFEKTEQSRNILDFIKSEKDKAATLGKRKLHPTQLNFMKFQICVCDLCTSLRWLGNFQAIKGDCQNHNLFSTIQKSSSGRE